MRRRRSYGPAKRALDLVGATVGLSLCSPLLALAAIAVRFTMGRPVLFRQARTGRQGEIFTLVKLRTMRAAADDGIDQDRQRLTALGRFLRATSIDELPSLWNVVKGEMSLVGPRPLLPQYVSRYSPQQARRLEVKPGLTGWCQVNGRNSLSWEEKFELDVWYVDNASLLVDLRILSRTLGKVLRREGINAAGSSTMPEFLGPGPP